MRKHSNHHCSNTPLLFKERRMDRNGQDCGHMAGSICSKSMGHNAKRLMLKYQMSNVCKP